MKMQKRIRLLYSDSKKGIMEELAEFKREPCVYNPKAPKLIAGIIRPWCGINTENRRYIAMSRLIRRLEKLENARGGEIREVVFFDHEPTESELERLGPNTIIFIDDIEEEEQCNN